MLFWIINNNIIHEELVVNQKMVSAHEYKAVAQVASNYVEALRIGSIEMLTDIFHKDSVTYGTVNSDLVGGGSSNPAAEFIKINGKSPELDSHIDVLDITPTTAVVRIIMEKDATGSNCNENLLLIKLNQGWTVIAKVFHQFDKWIFQHKILPMNDQKSLLGHSTL